jgi:hypothetical protein
MQSTAAGMRADGRPTQGEPARTTETVVRAAQIAQEFPGVGLDDDVQTAARVIARCSLPGVIVTGRDWRPRGVLSACDLLLGAMPGFVRESPSLALIYDERGADDAVRARLTRPVREILADVPVLVVDGEATAMELSAVMALARSALVLVRLADQDYGVVTVDRLLASLLAPV